MVNEDILEKNLLCVTTQVEFSEFEGKIYGTSNWNWNNEKEKENKKKNWENGICEMFKLEIIQSVLLNDKQNTWKTCIITIPMYFLKRNTLWFLQIWKEFFFEAFDRTNLILRFPDSVDLGKSGSILIFRTIFWCFSFCKFVLMWNYNYVF